LLSESKQEGKTNASAGKHGRDLSPISPASANASASTSFPKPKAAPHCLRTHPATGKINTNTPSCLLRTDYGPILAVFFLAIRRYNKRPYVRFHAWQSLVFNVYVIFFGYVLVFVLRFTGFLGPRVLLGLICLVALLVFLVWLWCVIGAWNGKRVKLPVIGDWAEEQAYR